MTYVPDPREYQQFGNGDPNAGVNCTADGAAFRCDAHTKGLIKITARQVRAHTDEPVPDPRSPGLNLAQVDAAVFDITDGKVDFDTRVQLRSLSRADAKFRIVDGRFAGLSVLRGVLVNRGFVAGFRGLHDITVFTRDTEPDQPLMFDSLVRTITRVSWDVVFDAAEAATGGRIYAQFTRDLTPDYHAVIPKLPAGTTFRRFHLDGDGRIADVTHHGNKGPTDYRCTPPRYHGAAKGKPTRWGRQLVQITQPGARRDGWWVSSRWAEELNP